MRDRLYVLQMIERWLPSDRSWLYWWMRHLPDDVEPVVFCEERVHDVEFALPHIFVSNGAATGFAPVDAVLRAAADSMLLGGAVGPMLAKLEHTHRVSFAREFGVDIVHSHFARMAWASRAMVRNVGARHIVTLSEDDLRDLPSARPVWKERLVTLVDQVELALVRDEGMAERAAELGCDERKLHVVGRETSTDAVAEQGARLADLYHQICS